MARLFFSVGVSRDVASGLRKLQAQMGPRLPREGFRFVEADQAHYTLRFLGEEPIERQTAAIRAGHGAALGLASFVVMLEGLGVFPDVRHAHTLWIGAGRGSAELITLATRLEAQLLEHGFSGQDRLFVPHLTIARIKRRIPAAVLGGVLQTPLQPVGRLTVESFALMESHPTSRGVRYLAVETFRLESACTQFS